MIYKATYQKTIWATALIEAKNFTQAEEKAHDLDYIKDSWEWDSESVLEGDQDFVLEDLEKEE